MITVRIPLRRVAGWAGRRHIIFTVVVSGGVNDEIFRRYRNLVVTVGPVAGPFLILFLRFGNSGRHGLLRYRGGVTIAHS